MPCSWKAALGLACAALLGAQAAAAKPPAKKPLKYDDAKMNPASPDYDEQRRAAWLKQQPRNKKCRNSTTGEDLPMDDCARAALPKKPSKQTKKRPPPSYDDGKMNPASPDYDEKALATWRKMQPNNRKCRNHTTGEELPMEVCARAGLKKKKAGR